MKKPTPQHLESVADTLALVVSRPSFAVAMRWIHEGSGAERSPAGFPTSVGMLCFLLEATWGAQVSTQTMALALENSGFRIAARSFGPDMAYELATNVNRSSINRTPWQTEKPNPACWAWALDEPGDPRRGALYANLLRH